jgi:hypothetical protein
MNSISNAATPPMRASTLDGLIKVILMAPFALITCLALPSCNPERTRDGAVTSPVAFARQTFESLAKGEPAVARQIDWPVLTVHGENVGQRYVALTTNADRERFVNGFITQFATSFRESGGALEHYTNWRVAHQDALGTTVSADSPAGVLTMVLSDRDNEERVVSINVSK